jgi:hypothetical protein
MRLSAYFTVRALPDEFVNERTIDRLVNNAIMVAVPEREHAGAATEGFC